MSRLKTLSSKIISTVKNFKKGCLKGISCLKCIIENNKKNILSKCSFPVLFIIKKELAVAALIFKSIGTFLVCNACIQSVIPCGANSCCNQL